MCSASGRVLPMQITDANDNEKGTKGWIRKLSPENDNGISSSWSL